MRQHFTFKERDNETGLDFFEARYYASTQGRFTGADRVAIGEKQLVNPQDLNRYVYVANNPLKFIDPDGAEKIQVVVTTFIPTPTITAPIEGGIFKGDDRSVGESGSYRTTQIITIETDPAKGPALASEYHGDGTTQELNPDGSYKGEPAQGSGNSLELAVTRNDSGVNIHVRGNESDPLVTGAPGITYDVNINVQSQGAQGNVTVHSERQPR